MQTIIIRVGIFAYFYHLNSERESKVNNIYYKKRQCCFDEHSRICDDDNKNFIERDKTHTCCFFGHRKIKKTEALWNKVYTVIEELIRDYNVHIFLFGSKSEFDDLCLNIVTELKEKYPYINRVYVRAAYADINDDYTDYLLKSYEDTYFPERMRGAGRASYVERNQEMINKSTFCVVYYDETYSPPRRKNSCRDLTDYQPKSGTKLAYDYANKKGLKIINMIN